MSSQSPLTILLVDDDPTFGRIFRENARKRNVSVILCISLDNPELLTGQVFHAAIVDYDLGELTGPELGQELSKLFNDLPIILISGTDRTDKTGWPEGVKEFVPKSAGAEAILDAALRAATETTK